MKKKEELVAIYRLEFYRQQKNWKLCGDAQRQREAAAAEQEKAAPVVPSLNKTYSLSDGDEAGAGAGPELDQAFLGTAYDTQSSPPPNSMASQHSWSSGFSAGGWCSVTHVSPEAHCEELQDIVPQMNPGVTEWYKDWPNPVAAGSEVGGWQSEPREVDGWPLWEPPVRHDYDECNGWPVQSQVWNRNEQLYDGPVCSEDVELELERYERIFGSPPSPSPPPATWVRGAGLLRWMLTGEGGEAAEGDSLDSSGFYRQAHCVPHSSELEIDADKSADDEAAGAAGRPDAAGAAWRPDAAGAAWRLGAAALRAAGRAHCAALRALAAEWRARERLLEAARQRRMGGSREEEPTRDVGPSRDVILAGSHAQREQSGAREHLEGLKGSVGPLEGLHGPPGAWQGLTGQGIQQGPPSLQGRRSSRGPPGGLQGPLGGLQGPPYIQGPPSLQGPPVPEVLGLHSSQRGSAQWWDAGEGAGRGRGRGRLRGAAPPSPAAARGRGRM